MIDRVGVLAGKASPAYRPLARLLHWLTAALVIGLIPVGFVMANLGAGPLQNFLFRLHESVGATLLLIVAGRLLHRLAFPPAPLPAEIPAFQRIAATTVHWGLYGLLIIQPIVGWIGTSAYRAPIQIFWLFELPPIAAENRAFSDQMFEVHEAIGIALTVLICAHAGAALYHHFIRRDGVLMRMLGG